MINNNSKDSSHRNHAITCAWFWRKKCQFQILVIVIDSMCGDPISDILYLAIPTVLLGAGAFFMIGKDGRKKIEEIFR